jgi:hypothetical protein
MEHHEFLKQVVDYNKNLFNTTYKSAVTVQDEAEKVLRASLENDTFDSKWFNNEYWTVENKEQAVNKFFDFYKKARDEYKKTADANFSKFESFFAANTKAAPVTKTTAKAKPVANKKPVAESK